jgi:hypothetical protein
VFGCDRKGKHVFSRKTLFEKNKKKNKAMTATARNSGIYCAITV